MRRTCVFFHAHPDDEALLTAGTMARLAAEGHRVVLVVATDGGQGLAAPVDGRLGDVRLAELYGSARTLGVARVVPLGYPDSGLTGTAGFSKTDVDEAAARLAKVLEEEAAHLLTIYDPAGGYGHPDHVQVHRVGARAAELAGTPIVLEATVDRDPLLRLLRVVALFHRGVKAHLGEAGGMYTAATEITHAVPVRRHARAKREAMRAHASQATGGDSVRLLAILSRLPLWLFRLTLGTEWYVRRGLPPTPRRTHPLAG